VQTLNSLVYAVSGGMEDWAYAGMYAYIAVNGTALLYTSALFTLLFYASAAHLSFSTQQQHLALIICQCLQSLTVAHTLCTSAAATRKQALGMAIRPAVHQQIATTALSRRSTAMAL
jgi:hypothetical protein